MKNDSFGEVKETKFIHAVIPLTFLVCILTYTIRYTQASPHIPIIISGMLAVFIAMFVLKYKWAYLIEGILNTIKSSMEAVLILLVIGMLVGSWIISGVVPTMIFYGLKIISPGNIFTCCTYFIFNSSTNYWKLLEYSSYYRNSSYGNRCRTRNSSTNHRRCYNFWSIYGR